MKKWILIGIGIAVVAAGAFATTNKVSPVSWGWWGTYNAMSGLALEGYDPVAYFAIGEPARGDDQFSYDWGGVTWQFASAENRDLFARNPEQYAPQFGGFCSFAVSKGFTADISPDAWHIHEGKLYVFADSKVKSSWVNAIDDGSLQSSAGNWAKR